MLNANISPIFMLFNLIRLCWTLDKEYWPNCHHYGLLIRFCGFKCPSRSSW